jgi:hypothetical protein
VNLGSQFGYGIGGRTFRSDNDLPEEWAATPRGNGVLFLA